MLHNLFLKIFPNKNNQQSSLLKALIQNKGTYTINKNGEVSLDMSNKEVQKSIINKIQQTSSLHEEFNKNA